MQKSNKNILSIQTTLNKAIELANQNQLSDALILFKNVENEGLVNYNLYKFMANLFQRLDKKADAIKYFNKSLLLNQKQIDVLYSLGVLEQQIGHHDLAISNFNKALEIDNQAVSIWISKGHSLNEEMRLEEAIFCFREALKIDSDNINALLDLSSIYKKTNEFKLAEKLIKKAIEIKPNEYRALFNLAVNLYDQGRFKDAIEQYILVQNIKPDSVNVYIKLGLCYLMSQQTTQALEQFERGLDIDPYNQELNKLYSSLSFELDCGSFLERYKKLTKKTITPPLFEDYIKNLLLVKQFAQAEEEIKAYKKQHGNNERIQQLSFTVLAENNNYQQIVNEIKESKIISPGSQVTLVESYLALGEITLALNELEKLLSVKVNANNQYLWALYSVALRIDNSEKYPVLCNYDNLLIQRKIEFPKRYANIISFNDALLEAIEKTHSTKKHPLEQSLVGGTQTPGFIFDQPDNIFQELRTALSLTIKLMLTSTIQQHNKLHPTWSRWSDKFDFSTAWSVWLNSSGFHKSHIHSKGWLSSAYYVSVPEIIDQNNKAGYLKFGDVPIHLTKKLLAEKYIMPEAGKLVLFPSFFWHGTEPFVSDKPRVSVAFDLIPK